jgi:hypothetical protein
MLDTLDEATDERIKTFGEIERDKLRVSRANNKRVKEKSFQARDLIWRWFCPLGLKETSLGNDHQIGKDYIESRK